MKILTKQKSLKYIIKHAICKSPFKLKILPAAKMTYLLLSPPFTCLFVSKLIELKKILIWQNWII